MVARARPLARGPNGSLAVVPMKEKSMVPRNSTSRDTTNVLE
jgi:hypothetical protein